jgi:transcriptional regulator with XRE-family HTH domain
MPATATTKPAALRGHALRNHNLRKKSLRRAQSAPPLAKKTVQIRVQHLGITRIELSRQSGISRGALRDMELGVHVPTRNTLERFIEYCQSEDIDEAVLDKLRDDYTGPADSLLNFVGRMELKAGSSPKLARKVGVSPATLWEYRRGNFPVPYKILVKMCKVTSTDFEVTEALWHEAERQRFHDRGFPAALAELCVLRLRAGHAESALLELGLGTAELRRLCYLELLPWNRISPVIKTLTRTDDELKALREIWQEEYREQKHDGLHAFGLKLKKMREKQGATRREYADLFGVGGRKPARTIKHIEEDGHYSQQAFPAGLIALVTDNERLWKTETPETDDAEGDSGDFAAAPQELYLQSKAAIELREFWERRRIRFHLRHRPEMQLDLRLQREFFGFDVGKAAAILGYASLEYQKIERGIEPLTSNGRERIMSALAQAGQEKVDGVFDRRDQRDVKREAWKTPTSVTDMIKALASREGGIVPLSRTLKAADLYGVSPPRLRSYLIGDETPTWFLLQQIADVCKISKLQVVHIDWIHRYREQLKTKNESLLAIELRLLMAEVAPTIREFSKRLPFNYSVLLRDLYKVEQKLSFKWFHVERILKAAGLPENSERWRVIHRLWITHE